MIQNVCTQGKCFTLNPESKSFFARLKYFFAQVIFFVRINRGQKFKNFRYQFKCPLEFLRAAMDRYIRRSWAVSALFKEKFE
jgi:hypothetical protein